MPTLDFDEIVAPPQDAGFDEIVAPQPSAPSFSDIARNAGSAAIETVKGLVPTSLHDFERMVNPLETAIPEVANAAGAVRDWIGGGKSADQIAQERFPESQLLTNADKTPAYSKERFAAGFNTLAQLGMLAAAGRGERAVAERPRVIPAEIVFDEVVPPNGKRMALPAPAEEPRAGSGDLAAAPVEVVPQGGGIPIEGLEDFRSPATEAASAPISFRDDPDLSASRKIQLDDAASAAGLSEEQIANLTFTDAAAIESAQYRDALRQEQTNASTQPAATSADLRPLRSGVGEETSLQQQGEIAPAGEAQDAPTPEEIARREYEQSLVDDANAAQNAQGDELHQAIISAGGLPSKLSEARGPFAGELARIEDAVRNPLRRERLPDTLRLFRQDAPDVDELATRLRDRGFDVQTPADLLSLAEDRYTTGRQVYGQPELARVFASGTSAPSKFSPNRSEHSASKRPAEQDIESAANLRSPAFPQKRSTPVLRAAHESASSLDQQRAVQTSPSGSSVEPASPRPHGIALPRSDQAKTFAAGAAAPQPHAPPRPRAPTPPPAVPNPTAALAVVPVRSWWQERTLGLRKIVAPQTIDAPARMVANIIRDYNGQLANKIAQADHALADARKSFDRTPVPRSWQYDPALPLPRNYAFMAESERGGKGLSPDDLKLKTQLDSMFAEAVDEVHRVKPAALKSLIQDYFPHIWEDPEKARNAFASIVGSRPLEGPKGFLKQRTLAYVEDGLKMGLRPISDNPIDVVLTKLHEVHRFVAAQDMLGEAKAIGARKFVYIFEKAPDGWVKVDDPTSTVHGPPFVTVPEAFDEQMRVKTVELLKSLGVPNERVASLGKSQRWGEASDARNPANNLAGDIRTKFAGPLSVYWHELGHVLEFRYKWLDAIAPLRRYPKGYDGQIVERQRDNFGGKSVIEDELRRLADLRSPQQPPKDSFKSYIRSRDEKAAVMLEAYVHAPARMQQVAPHLYNRVRKFIAAHPELAPIEEIRPSLVIGSSKQQIPVGGMVTLGHYYMPEGAAAVFNNYLSPGLQRFGVIRSIRQSTNVLSGMQLGFSAFHAGFTSIDAAVSQFALALRYASEGKLGKAIEKTLTTPAAPVTNYLLGSKVRRAMLEPTYGTPEIQNIAQLAVKAGLRASADPFWQTHITRNMMRAWHEGGVKGYAGTILRAPFAASEQLMRPILEHLVPRQKLGVFAGMAQAHIERLGPNADIHAVRDALARAADSTEDRMGQMTYDNLFYNKAVRDAALLGFRAYGWTFGKYRALFGGVGDTLRLPGRVASGEPFLTDRMAYLLALPIVAAGIGSVMNYAMTGQAPQDWKDALMPRTGKLDRNGNPQRLSLPTYIKDILSDWHDFPDTKKMLVSVGHKLNPWFSVAADIVNNADYYHTKVFNEDDPFWKRQMDKVAFVAKSALPFAVTSTQKLQESKPTLAQQVLPFFGFVPAKQELSMSPAQIRAAELYRETQPQGARTAEEANHGKLFAQLMRDMKDADPNWQTSLTTSLQTGHLRATDVPRLLQSLPLNPLQYQVKKLEAEPAMKVWDLANAAERQQIRTILIQKIATSKTLTPQQRVDYIRVMNAAK